MADRPAPFDGLPELTLSLRSFGSRRRGSLEGAAVREEQERYFAPLLDARRHAATAVARVDVVTSFDARRLLAALDATLRAFASQRYAERPPARRAFEAELFEVAEPFRIALQVLGERARDMTANPTSDEPDAWQTWLVQLRATFRAADDSWPSLRAVLDMAPASPSVSGKGWPRSPRGGGSP